MPSDTEASDELRAVAGEQAALQRVAKVVAEGASTEQVLEVVCEEAGRLLGVPGTAIERYDSDGCATVLATWAESDGLAPAGFELGSRRPRGGPRGGSAVGVPITVDGRTWGVIYASTSAVSVPDLPAEIGAQLARVADLVEIEIANVEARTELRGLVEEQAALRRIATLVARGADEKVVFAAVSAETGLLVHASSVNLARFTPDGFYVAVAGWSLRHTHVETGTRLPLEPGSLSEIVWRTATPARLDSYDDATGQLGRLVRSMGICCTIGVPIIVEGRLWGALIPGRDWDAPFPVGTEERVARFAELTATSISNATARSELIASRARIIAAGDEARRKIERNLHDGIQQRLIALSLDLESVRETIPPDDVDARAGLARVARELEAVHEDLRQFSHGLHPSLLSRRGLAPALAALARTSPIPVKMHLDVTERLPQPTEIGVYYVVAEALTNAAKHSQAAEVTVTVTRGGETVRAGIEDDGLGGADASAGTGLAGLIDRVEALGGRLEIDSLPGEGTRISVALPIG